MKYYFVLLLLCLGAGSSLYGQGIIPFPDLSESHIAVYNQKEVFDEHNYSLFTEAYQEVLRKVDINISEIEEQINSITDPRRIALLESEKKTLNLKRSKLLEEAALVDDLNKFY